MARYKKFIILENRRNCELDIRLGYPIYHADLIENTDKREGWKCIGGGFWDINFETKEIYLYGSSSDFGTAPKQKIEESLKSMNDHKWWQFGWICEQIFGLEHPDIDYDYLDKEFKFIINY